MNLHEGLLMAVESAVLIVGLLHIYLELRKRKKSLPIRITVWYIDRKKDVKEEANEKK